MTETLRTHIAEQRQFRNANRRHGRVVYPVSTDSQEAGILSRIERHIEDRLRQRHGGRRAGARACGEAEHRGGYDPILKQLNRLNVGHITMEFTSPGAGDMSVFQRLPEHIEIGLGCVSCQPGQIDSADTIVERVEMALRYLKPERITLNPDCGFAPGSAANVSIDEVYLKLQHEVAAAHHLREKYG